MGPFRLALAGLPATRGNCYGRPELAAPAELPGEEDAIVALLREAGEPMSAREIADFLHLSVRQTHDRLATLRNNGLTQSGGLRSVPPGVWRRPVMTYVAEGSVGDTSICVGCPIWDWCETEGQRHSTGVWAGIDRGKVGPNVAA